MSLTLVLIRGLPGSGKSTMAKKFAARGYKHFEADQYFEDEDGSYAFDWRDLHYAHSQCLTKTSQCLVEGKSCVVSNTFTTFGEIELYFQVAGAMERVSIFPSALVILVMFTMFLRRLSKI